MTCERYQRGLALYVEADLPADASAVVERHLRTCEPCQGFLRSLAESQQLLKGLAAEPLDDAAVLALRVRVLTASTSGAARVAPSRPWLWALAAGLVLLAAGFGALRLAIPVRPPLARSIPEPAPAPRPSAEAARPARVAAHQPASTSRPQSTIPTRLAVSPDVGLERPNPASLTTEEADQLARAVVLVSQIDRLPAEPEATSETLARLPPTDVIQLATADPGVVIYFQVDSIGG
jgi:anti-sigma factor RsiW